MPFGAPAYAQSQPVHVHNYIGPGSPYPRAVKSKGTAIVLALLLGGLGIHKFYLGRGGAGILYLLFCWTFIPAIIAFFEALGYAFMSGYAFHAKYG